MRSNANSVVEKHVSHFRGRPLVIFSFQREREVAGTAETLSALALEIYEGTVS